MNKKTFPRYPSLRKKNIINYIESDSTKISKVREGTLIKYVNAIFASASSNLTDVVNKGYGCSRLTTTTTSTSNCLILLNLI